MINRRDAAGDEGAIFAQFVLGNHLTTGELNLLKAEDDRAYVTVNGQQLLIEQQNIVGDYQGNILTGTAGDDLIQGLGGNDTLSGLGGNDTLDGGAGDDTITGGTGNDIIVFDRNQNNDVVTDFVRGQDKIDVRNLNISDWSVLQTLITDDGQNNALITISYGGSQSQLKLNGINPTLLQASDFILNNVVVDRIVDGTNYYGDYVFGGLGNDTLNGYSGADFLYGGQGNDILNSGAGNDTITGGTGNDVIVFDRTQDNDVVTDFVRGQDKIDVRNLNISDWAVLQTLISDDGQNNALITISYGGSQSQLKLKGINPTLLQASDFILNNMVVDRIVDGTSYYGDYVFGGLGNDTLNGYSGADVLYGGQGNDILNSGAGNDILTGGTGNDVIVFDRTQDNDVVTDFVRGQDKIDVRNLNISDWSVLQTLITDDGQNNALITISYGGSQSQLKLNGINPTLLQASDFILNNVVVNRIVDGTTYYGDYVFGGLGNDTLNGYSGADFLYGGRGNDILTGGTGNDLLDGGLGDDIAVFTGTRAQYQLTNTNGVYTVNDLVTNRDGIDTLLSIQKIKFSDQTLVIAPIEATVTLAVNPITVNEDGTTNLAYTFTRTGSTTETLVVNYTVSGTATFNTDYTQTGATSFTATTGTITFAANSATATLTIDPQADATVEANETLSLQLTANPNYTIGTPTVVTGTITNDDVLNQTGVALSINNITVVEGKDANALLTVSLSSASTQPISVNYTTTAINATANGDYTTRTGTLVIPANTLIGTISIPILNDNLNEADESFIITLSNPVNATIDPDTSIGEVIITDTLRSAVTRILPASVENLTLIGAGAINGTGNAGNNTIVGNSAANTLYGAAGIDILTGGLGSDIFRFNSKTEGIDTITDFTAGDKIAIAALGFGGGLTGTAITATQFLSVTLGSAATNSSQRVIYNSTTGGLYFDADGSGVGAAVQFANLSTHPTLGATDFLVV